MGLLVQAEIGSSGSNPLRYLLRLIAQPGRVANREHEVRLIARDRPAHNLMEFAQGDKR